MAPGRNWGDLGRRSASTAVIVPVTFAAVWAGGPWLAALLAAAAAIGGYELAGLASRAGTRPIMPIAVAWSVGLVVATHVHVTGQSLAVTVLPVLIAGAAASLVAFPLGSMGGTGRGMTGATRDYVATAGSALFAGGLLSFGLLLRGLSGGNEWAVAVVLIVAAADVGGYAVGLPYGRHKIATAISPAKSWEGAAGGLAAAIGISIAVVAVFDLPVSTLQAAGLGALLWAGALAGDFSESGLKRRAGVKDSGGLIPGHGGVFDRLDSIVLNLLLTYYFVLWVTS
jgi:phosphatidate cytidylyltransferase